MTEEDEYGHPHEETWFVVLHDKAAPAPYTRGGTPVDLTAGELPEDLVGEILDENVVVLSAPADLGIADLDILRERTPVPLSFQRSGWLYDHHVLVLTDGRWTCAELEIEQRPGQGLRVSGPDTD